MTIPDPMNEEETTFFARLGEILVRWNDLEAITRLHLYFLLPSGRASDCVVGVMSLSAVLASIKSIVELNDNGEIAEHKLRLCALISRAQEYRNLYVHGPRLIARANDELTALMQDVRVSNGSAFLKSASMKLADLDCFIQHLKEVRTYSDVIMEQTIPDHLVTTKRSCDDFVPPFLDGEKPTKSTRLKDIDNW